MPLSLAIHQTIILPTIPTKSEILGVGPATCVVMSPPGDAHLSLRTTALSHRVSKLRDLRSGHRRRGNLFEDSGRELETSNRVYFLFRSLPGVEITVRHGEKVLNTDPGGSENPGSEKLLAGFP